MMFPWLASSTRLFPVAAACFAALLCAGVSADVVTAGGTEHRDVQVQTFRAGSCFYLDHDSNLVQAPVEAIESIRFDDLPELNDAERSRRRGEWEEALPDLLQAMLKAQSEAQRVWLHARLAEAHGALGDSIEAAGHLGALLEIDPSPAWLHLRPEGELNEPTFYSAGEADYYLRRARRRATDDAVIAALDALIARIEPIAKELAAADARQYRPGSTISGILRSEIGKDLPPRERGAREGDGEIENASEGEGRGESGHMPADLRETRPEATEQRSAPVMTGPEAPTAIESLLETREFAAALAICRRIAQEPGERDLAHFLHQYGLALAGAGHPADAAIRHMQCAIEFPTTSWATRSLVETALIYRDQFRKPQTARRLLEAALNRSAGAGDEELSQRITALLNDLPS